MQSTTLNSHDVTAIGILKSLFNQWGIGEEKSVVEVGGVGEKGMTWVKWALFGSSTLYIKPILDIEGVSFY